MIRRVFIRARQQFGLPTKEMNTSKPDMELIETLLFNVDDLCPTNAPRRCPECKGPYHIRKRCPKLITLENEKEKSKQANYRPHQQQQVFVNNQYGFYPNLAPNNFQFPPYQQYYYPNNGYQYAFPVGHHQRVWTQPYSNERPIIYSNMPYYSNEQQQQTSQFNRLFYSNNQQRKCFQCGSPNHLKAQCTQFQTNTVQR